jgi:hypothetical protein
VTRDYAALNKAVPGWLESIDLATFDMSRPGQSLLTQLFGSPAEGLKRLGIPEDEAGDRSFGDTDPAEVRIWLVLITTVLAENRPSGRPPPPPIPAE